MKDTRHAIVDTVLGKLTLVAGGNALAGVYFPQHWVRPARAGFGPEVAADHDELLAGVRAQLIEYLSGVRTAFELPMAAGGDAFQQRVWALLAEIPRGRTATYGELAEQLGDRRLA
ncbi:MAG: methylated-DNA--[protein]-cysteine S-methyltransferase, partial [Jatrophihabitans sp.]